MSYKDKKMQKKCQREYYLRNKEKYAANIVRRRQEYNEWYEDIRKDLCCKECGENHIATLDFHHRDRKEKSSTIARMVKSLISKKKILEEIEKCDVLCSNCHRKLHWELEHKKQVE